MSSADPVPHSQTTLPYAFYTRLDHPDGLQRAIPSILHLRCHSVSGLPRSVYFPVLTSEHSFLEAPFIQQPSQRFHGAEPQALYRTNSYGTHGYDLGPLPLPNNNDFTTFSMMDAPVDPDYVHSDRLLQDWDAYLMTGIMPPVPRLHSDHHFSSSQCDQPFATNAPINMLVNTLTSTSIQLLILSQGT